MKITVVAILCLMVSASLLAQEDPVEARLRALEEKVAGFQALEDQVADLKKENEQLRRDLGVEVMARQSNVKMSGRSQGIQLGGLLQAQTEGGDRGDSRFSDSNARAYLRRARMNLSGRFLEEFNVRAELELAGSLANTTGFRAQLTDAFLNWNRFDSANVRIGQFKTPFGFEQLYADPRLYTAERSLASDRLTPGRQIGVQLGGEVFDQRVNYSVGLFNGSGTNQNFNDNDRFMTVGRVSVVPLTGRFFENQARWTVGVNGFRTTDSNITLPAEFGFDSTPASPAKDNIFAGRRRAIGYDTQVEIGPFELWGEYLRGTFEPVNRVPASRFHADGWSVQASYYVIFDKLQLVERLEVFDPSNLGNVADTRSLVTGLNWYFKQHDVKLQVDWMRTSVPGVSNKQSKIIARLQTVF